MSDCRLILGDALAALPAMGRGGVDAVVTDIPYGLGERWKRKSHGSNGRSRLWTGEVPEWDAETPHELVSMVVATAPLWTVWGSYNTAMPQGKGMLVWDKIQATNRSEGEAAHTNTVAGVRFFRMSRIDAYVNKAVFRKEHPNEKPVQLMAWCLSFLPEGCTVLDPFMGSGTTGVACIRTGRNFVGIEKDERYFLVAEKRLAAARAECPLFPEGGGA